MRAAYQEELTEIQEGLIQMAELVVEAVHQATKALLTADVRTAEDVIAGDQAIDDARNQLDKQVLVLLARQTPVAGDLRTVVATLRLLAELERMGDLAAHIAKIARMRFPEPAVPEALRPNFERMAEVAEKMVTSASQNLRDRDIEVFDRILDQDEETDELRRRQFHMLLGEEWSHGVEAAVDVALLGRYYERIADHAATLARRVVFIVTGKDPGGALAR